jgi:perosamine synthetase
MIPIANPDLSGNEEKYLIDAFRSGYISSRGDYIQRFENSFSEFVNSKYSVSVFNGTVALQLVVAAMGIGRDDEVIMPVTSFIATANAVRHAGAKPVFVDINSDDWCINVDEIEGKITDKTKAIMAVHLYGHPAPMTALKNLANRYGLYLIEDCAEAHGATYEGIPVGAIGDAGTFSFFGNKIMTTGEGGMVTTNSKELYERMLILKNHGSDASRSYWHPIAGFNYRMTNLQAAIGLAQLERIDEFLNKRQKIFDFYDENLAKLGFTLQPKKSNVKCAPWMYSALLPRGSINLEQFREALRVNGVDSRPLFSPMSIMPPYENGVIYKNADHIAKDGFNLPTSPMLSSVELGSIMSAIKKVIA